MDILEDNVICSLVDKLKLRVRKKRSLAKNRRRYQHLDSYLYVERN